MPGRLALALVILAIASILSGVFVAQSVSAQSVNVSADIPVGIIRVQGKTSPNAQVKLFENNNTVPSASILADANGVYSKDLPQDSIGLVNISVKAIDTDGKESGLITKQVAVLDHQTSTLTIIIPPTVVVLPNTAVFRTGTLNFSGQTAPNATIQITIEPSTILSTTANNQGVYEIPFLVESLHSVGIYTFGVEVSIGVEQSDYVIAGTFTITPPVPQILPPASPFRKLAAPKMTPPTITSPIENDITTNQPFVMSGKAMPGSTVTLFDTNEIIGSVNTNEEGDWQFYFSPFKTAHNLHATACFSGKCSDPSRTVRIEWPESKGLPLCATRISLKGYTLASVAGIPTKLTGALPEALTGIAYISWGDGSSEQFTIDAKTTFNTSHTYGKAGLYNGFVILNNEQYCYAMSYFTVDVRNQSLTLSTLTTVLVASMAVVVLSWIGMKIIKVQRV